MKIPPAAFKFKTRFRRRAILITYSLIIVVPATAGSIIYIVACTALATWIGLNEGCEEIVKEAKGIWRGMVRTWRR